MDAVFSADRIYRYTLSRLVPVTFSFEERKYGGNHVMFIGLNPSTADEVKNDPTIRRCRNFASRWGFSKMVMTNLFAFRSTMPEIMKRAGDPVGPDNDRWLKEIARDAGLIVACWGNHGSWLFRSDSVKAMIPNLHCLRVTGKGQPEHPLYLPGGLEPQPWT